MVFLDPGPQRFLFHRIYCNHLTELSSKGFTVDSARLNRGPLVHRICGLQTSLNG